MTPSIVCDVLFLITQTTGQLENWNYVYTDNTQIDHSFSAAGLKVKQYRTYGFGGEKRQLLRVSSWTPRGGITFISMNIITKQTEWQRARDVRVWMILIWSY